MARVRVLGAGVVGSVYAALLADAGHEVTLIARGSRLVDLRRHGLLVGLDGRILAPDVAVTKSPEVTDCDVLLVAVRGDQLAAALDDIAASPAGWVWMFTNPLELRSDVEDRLGRDRLVWCFSGVGGGVKDGQVTAHRVGQQPTVVEGEDGPELHARGAIDDKGNVTRDDPAQSKMFEDEDERAGVTSLDRARLDAMQTAISAG